MSKYHKWLDGIPDEMIRVAIKDATDKILEEIKKMEPTPSDNIRKYFMSSPNIHIIHCSDCSGTGRVKWWWIFKRKCRKCGGSGKSIEYKFPKYVEYARRIEYGEKV